MVYKITSFCLMVPFCSCPIEGMATGTIEVVENDPKVKLHLEVTDLHYNYQVWQAIVAGAMIPARHPTAKLFAINTTMKVLNNAPLMVKEIDSSTILLTPYPDDNVSRLKIGIG